MDVGYPTVGRELEVAETSRDWPRQAEAHGGTVCCAFDYKKLNLLRDEAIS